MRILFTLLALSAATIPAHAAGSLALRSDVFVERVAVQDGKTHIVLAPSHTVVPGDRLVFVLDYRNTSQSPATNMIVTNPVPATVSYEDADGALVSVDGGKSWGTLASARIRLASGALRPARPDDVTHIRWQLAGSVPAGAGGKLKFRGTVR